jgi:DNA repair exonuclease SbcCD nuclease subunit
MKVAIITDTHFNFKKGNKFFHEYFEKFYTEVFFPTLRKYKIDTVIHLGDIFDNRKFTDYWSIDWTKRVILEPLKKYNVHLILGNHDLMYKNTTKLNSPVLLLSEYKNINIYSQPKEVVLGNTNCLFIPWVTDESESQTLTAIKSTDAKIAMGHLELSGFYVNKKTFQEHGRDKNLFNKFDKVFSGHYHTRSDDGKIFYLGNPYQMYWTDYNDTRGFTIFDTETSEIERINNPFEIFKIINYADDMMINLDDYENCIVKLVVKDNKDKVKYEKFLDFLLEANLQDLKIIEEVSINEDFEADEIVKMEDTLSLLKKYIDESEISLNKNKIKKLIQNIYQQSFQMQ